MGPVLESFRFVTVTEKVTATPSMVTKDQEILRDPTPSSVAARSAGDEGGPELECVYYITSIVCMFRYYHKISLEQLHSGIS